LFLQEHLGEMKLARSFPGAKRIGLISDTHGLLRDEALAALEGVDLILHAGDIGGADILNRLERVAPLIAVRGNNDRDPWAGDLPECCSIDVDGFVILLIHDLNELRRDWRAGVDCIVSGHSHRPLISERDGVIYVNPGAAGPRRFKLPISIGRLVRQRSGSWRASTTSLDPE
jgi:uncharacterized protein